MNSALRHFRSLGIARYDFVLEVGSGNNPYWRSDLLIDKYVSDAAERPGKRAPSSLTVHSLWATRCTFHFGIEVWILLLPAILSNISQT